jgi:DnaJ-domain-containing protein 1
MADNSLAEANRRKLEEHLARLQQSGGKLPPEEKAKRGIPQPPPIPPGWEAWKQAHGGRMHTVREVDGAKLAEAADFKLLELKPGASKDEIRKSFNRLAKQYHPDLGGDAEIFQAMQAAYKRLMKGA